MFSADATPDQTNPSASSSDPGGTTGTLGDVGALPGIERAAATAVEQHLSESRGRGKRGPDKRPRRPRTVPLEPMGNGSAEFHRPEAPPIPLEIGWEQPPPPFDEALAESLVVVSIGILNYGAAAVIRAIAKKETGDDLLASEAAASVRMPEKIEAAVKQGALACAKKYAVRLDYAPEVMLGGGLLIWTSQILVVKRNLVEKGAALREGQGAV